LKRPALLLATASIALLVGCDNTGHSPPTESRAKFTDFSLVRPGIVLELHPADSPIHLSATADAPLKVCQVGTTFAGYWKGGCRIFGDRPQALPTTNGFIHVVFRIAPTSGRLSRVRRLDVRWHCLDHNFGYWPGRSKVPVTRAIFDC
jgi:hypothetical protein